MKFKYLLKSVFSAPRLSEAVVRKCPRCHFQYVKASGCNKITCRCGAYICYLCSVIVNGYDHFCQCGGEQVIGRPCLRCGKTCPVQANADNLDNERINRIRVEAGL